MTADPLIYHGQNPTCSKHGEATSKTYLFDVPGYDPEFLCQELMSLNKSIIDTGIARSDLHVPNFPPWAKWHVAISSNNGFKFKKNFEANGFPPYWIQKWWVFLSIDAKISQGKLL